MIDLHSHILFDIDDGCRDIEQSLQLCDIAAQNGITHIAATPHFLTYFNSDEFFEKRNRNVRALSEQLKLNNIPVKMMIGAEVACSNAMFYFDKMKRLTINSGRYLLLEFPFEVTDTAELFDYVDYVYDCGLIPLIAHPERFSFFQNDYDLINELAGMECLFQVNTNSVSGLFGKKTQMLAVSMLKQGFVDVLATDAHSPKSRRSTDVNNHFELFPQDIITSKQLDDMTRQVPAAIAMDKDYKPQRNGYIKKQRGVF